MKPKRTILILDEEDNLAGLSVTLRMRYHILTLKVQDFHPDMELPAFVDLLLIGPRVSCNYLGDVPVIHRAADWTMAELLERIRIALIRKRGPKAVGSCQAPVVSGRAG